MTLLNLAEICPTTRTLGPGQRFAIWVQGCCFQCRGCISPDWIPQTTAHLVEPKRLAESILSVPGTVGVTVSGGEPMLQATALRELFTYLRGERDISIICYTGFTLEQLQTESDQEMFPPGLKVGDILGLLQMIDVLIDGQYIPELNDNQGWRGSANQRIHFLTSRHRHETELFTRRQRDVEIHLRGDGALMVGVPPQNLPKDFRLAVDAVGE